MIFMATLITNEGEEHSMTGSLQECANWVDVNIQAYGECSVQIKQVVNE